MPRFILSLVLLFYVFSTLGQTSQELVELGQKTLSRGDTDEAIETLSSAIAIDPENLNARLTRATAYTIAKKYENAVEDYSFVLETYQNRADIYIGRGSALHKLDKFAEALSDFDKAIVLDPKNTQAFNNRGWAKKGLGDHDGACADWKKSKKLGNSEAKIILKNNQC